VTAICAARHDLYQLFHRPPAGADRAAGVRNARQPGPPTCTPRSTALIDLVQTRYSGRSHRAARQADRRRDLGAAVLDVWCSPAICRDDRVIAGLVELVHTGVKAR